jgi:hypothetical protein
MLHGIEGKPLRVDTGLPYAALCNVIGTELDFPPCLLYAVAFRECIGEYGEAPDILSFDGGHGLCQLTSSFPQDWADPGANLRYAVTQFLIPAMSYWAGQGEAGDALVKLVADTYNEGLSAAIEYHAEGNADLGTTNHYGSNVLRIYHQLVAGEQPTL